MLETRVKTRRSVSRAASIHVDAVTILDCVVRDFSETGVRLEMVNTAAVPNEFMLRLAGVATPRLCRLAWRRTDSVGASFVRETTA